MCDHGSAKGQIGDKAMLIIRGYNYLKTRCTRNRTIHNKMSKEWYKNKIYTSNVHHGHLTERISFRRMTSNYTKKIARVFNRSDVSCMTSLWKKSTSSAHQVI